MQHGASFCGETSHNSCYAPKLSCSTSACSQLRHCLRRSALRTTGRRQICCLPRAGGVIVVVSEGRPFRLVRSWLFCNTWQPHQSSARSQTSLESQWVNSQPRHPFAFAGLTIQKYPGHTCKVDVLMRPSWMPTSRRPR